LLDGEYRRSEATESRDVIDPATGDRIAEIAETTATEVDAAVEAGHIAQKKWWRMSALERAEIMHEIANELLTMKPLLAEALTREMGKPYKESADEVDWSVSAIRYYAEIGRTDIGVGDPLLCRDRAYRYRQGGGSGGRGASQLHLEAAARCGGIDSTF